MARTSLLVSLLLLACATEPLDVGSTAPGAIDTGPPVDPPPGPPLPVWPEPGVCDADGEGDLVGVWEGAFEDENFVPMVPLRIEILSATATSGVCGIVYVGEGPPPPPPTDPGVTGLPADSQGWDGFFPGLGYTIMSGGVHDNLVHFQVNQVQLLRDWCALQTPVYDPSVDVWQCVPRGRYSLDGAGCSIYASGGQVIQSFTELQCEWCQKYLGVCACNRDGCTADPNSQGGRPYDFNLERTGDELFGTTSAWSSSANAPMTVALVRAP